ncbi:M20/M25/M40 family metallo-hydrolase [Azospirillum brasilense]|uniref:M28 family metallopeptidase n=1 Tax=Azospirillum argentinense TaxID=2970906 RepID=UPI001909D635|nr:M28 family metallopeptidase [Azospirillum argentinense]MBK3798122.1 M20/M25/M40 family metallo-hydrolase [Azospirillum argentinense]
MERVRLVTCRKPPTVDGLAQAAAPPDAVAEGNLSWIGFGDEMVCFGQEQDLARFVERADRTRLAPREYPDPIEQWRLHVVVQKGRLFQRVHPEVAVLADRGRFLLVDMDPGEARRANTEGAPCYTVRPLDTLAPAGASGRSWVTFESRDRAGARAPDEEIEKCLALLSRETFEEDLRALVRLPTRLSTSAHYAAACDFACQRLEALGYATSRQEILVRELPSQNVVAWQDGAGAAPRGLVLVTAHLDSINHEDNASMAPGADDDGSGSAGVIAIARALKDHSGTHDLCFVLFGGEEQGLLGSRRFVAAMTPVDQARTRAVVNMDMIGTLNIPTPTVLLEGAALSQGVIDGLADAAATYTGLTVQTSLHPANSDHVSFIEKGMPAVLTIEGADSVNDEIHTARDILDHINFDFALEILRMNTAFIAESIGRA